jgi:hypothetical protein
MIFAYFILLLYLVFSTQYHVNPRPGADPNTGAFIPVGQDQVQVDFLQVAAML